MNLKEINLETYKGSIVTYTRYEPEDSNIDLYISWDDGATWLFAENGSELPGINYGDSLLDKNILFKTVFKASTTLIGESDLPQIYDISISFIIGLLGGFQWVAESGAFEGGILHGLEYDNLKRNNDIDLNLVIDGSSDRPNLKIKTKEFYLGSPELRHQLRKIMAICESDGGEIYLNVYVDGNKVEEKKVKLQEDSNKWGPADDDVLIWDESKWGPLVSLNEIITSCNLNMGRTVAFEIVAKDQVLFRLHSLWAELFHRRKV